MQQTEDSRLISRQQKNTERFVAKRQILLTRKEECNRNIRDLGVLPEEAFEKYVNEKLDRVCISMSRFFSLTWINTDRQETASHNRGTQEVLAC